MWTFACNYNSDTIPEEEYSRYDYNAIHREFDYNSAEQFGWVHPPYENAEDLIAHMKELCNSDSDTPITSLGYSYTSKICLRMIQALSLNTTLTKLALYKANIGDEHAIIIAGSASLKTLSLFGNYVGDGGASALARNTVLTTLDVRKNKIGRAGVVALARNTTLIRLFLCYNNIGDHGAVALARNTTLNELDVCWNGIGESGAAALAGNSTLRQLELYGNKIGDGGAAAFMHNTTLIKLGLRSAQIDNDGVAALARNTTLTTVDLRHNPFGWSVEDALAANKSLTTIDMYDSIRQWMYRKVEERLYENQKETKMLMKALEENAALETIATLLRNGMRPYGHYIQKKLSPPAVQYPTEHTVWDPFHSRKDTFLHLAVRLRRPNLVDLLLQHGAGADRNTTNDDGVTYRELAKELGVQLSSAYFGTMAPYY